MVNVEHIRNCLFSDSKPYSVLFFFFGCWLRFLKKKKKKECGLCECERTDVEPETGIRYIFVPSF